MVSSAYYDALFFYLVNGSNVTYAYDTAARLTCATDCSGVIYAQNPAYLASAAMQEFSSPNFNGNKFFTVTNLKGPARTQSFTYDSLIRLASVQDAAHWSNIYTYDAWGNMLTERINNWTYVYDGENRITTPGSITYTYNADGRRVQKSSGTNYWYGPIGQVLAETDSIGTWTKYIFFAGQRIARNVNGDIKYFIADHLHSTGMFVDKASAIIDDNDLYPWGGVVPVVGQTTSHNTIKFTGQYRDGELQLDYFGARYYSNAIGRFMSPDWAAKAVIVAFATFGDPQSLNLYSYAENEPVNCINPDGHSFAFCKALNGAKHTELDDEVDFKSPSSGALQPKKIATRQAVTIGKIPMK